MNVRHYPRIATPALCCLIILIGFWDYRSGFRFSLFPLYLIPVTIVAWIDRKAVIVAVSFLAAAIVLVKDTLTIYPLHHGFYFFWDESTKIAILFVIGYGVWDIGSLLREKERANEELTKALNEIRELREMIPICSMCHSIRNDAGFYERIEVYLNQLTGAKLTHGICPACLEKYWHLQVPEAMEKPEPGKK